jgi:hypothetical protein
VQYVVIMGSAEAMASTSKYIFPNYSTAEDLPSVRLPTRGMMHPGIQSRPVVLGQWGLMVRWVGHEVLEIIINSATQNSPTQSP